MRIAVSMRRLKGNRKRINPNEERSIQLRLNTKFWSEELKHKGLLFFADSMAEMLFHHSHDSLKVNTLNFKFFWYDLLMVINDIEEGILDKGNIEPFIDEMQYFYKNDIVAGNLYGRDISVLFCTKDANGKYVEKFKDICKNKTSEATIQHLKRVCRFLIEDLESNDRYYRSLIDLIKTKCQSSLNSAQERELYLLTQSFLSELINRDYSQEYIFNRVMQAFFSEEPIDDSDAAIEKFVSCFTFKEKTFLVYFPLSYNLKTALNSVFKVETQENIFDMFGGKYQYVGRIEMEANDPEQARLNVSSYIDLIFSIIQYENHRTHTFELTMADVVDLEDHKCYFLRRPIPPILRDNGHLDRNSFTRNKSPLRIRSLVSAFGLHSSALRSNNINNQLLNLWTALEVVIPIERNGSYSKIGLATLNCTEKIR